MSNAEYLRSLYAAMDGLLTDLDANGSAEMAANSLRYHLKEHGLTIRPSERAAPRATPPAAPLDTNRLQQCPSLMAILNRLGRFNDAWWERLADEYAVALTGEPSNE